MRLLTLLFAGMSLYSVSLNGQTVDVHTHIIVPEYVKALKANLQRLRQTLASDEGLARYADMFLNAKRLFAEKAVKLEMQ